MQGRRYYSAPAFAVSSLFGGPLSAVAFAAIEARALGRLRRDLPWLALGFAAVLAAALWAAGSGLLDPALRDLYLGRAAERTGVRRDTLVSEVARERARSRVPRQWRSGAADVAAGDAAGVERAPIGSEADVAAERGLLLLLLRDGSLVERSIERGLQEDHFREPGHRSIYVALRAAEPDADAATLAEGLEAGEQETLRRLIEDSTELVHPGEVYEEALRRLLNRQHLDRLRQIDGELELADEEQARRLLVEKSELARALREAGVSLSFVRSYAGTGGSRGR